MTSIMKSLPTKDRLALAVRMAVRMVGVRVAVRTGKRRMQVAIGAHPAHGIGNAVRKIIRRSGPTDERPVGAGSPDDSPGGGSGHGAHIGRETGMGRRKKRLAGGLTVKTIGLGLGGLV